MKRLAILLLLIGVLAGCSAADYEKMEDVYIDQELPQPADLLVSLPPDAVQMTGQDENNLWLCDGYTVSRQTYPAGDLDATLLAVTGQSREKLNVLSLSTGNLKRYECAHVSAGEGGDQVARTVILDDGNYHYAITVQADAEKAGQLRQTWQQMLQSVTLDIVP